MYVCTCLCVCLCVRICVYVCQCASVRPHLQLGALAAVGGEGLELLLDGGELVALELTELLPLLGARLARHVVVQ